MALVINTNAAATGAANNLASSTAALQRSLNRLSSGSRIVSPADDAGGLAVSMKFSAASRRMAATESNISNSLSYLQSQDAALKAVGTVLDRMSMLKTLSADPTKNTSDLTNYNAEFVQLQKEISSLAQGTFNGVSLFGSTAMNVGTTEAQDQSVSMSGVNLMGTGAAAWSNVSNVTSTDWNITPSAFFNPPTFMGVDHSGTGSTKQTNISGPFKMSFTFLTLPASDGNLKVTAGGSVLDLGAIAAAATGGQFVQHTITITDDGSTASWALSTGEHGSQASIATPGGAAVTFSTDAAGVNNIYSDFSLTSTGSGNVSSVTAANSLSSASLSTITGALQDVATYRANIGANQSRLGYSIDLLATNKANIDQSNSRITDVDVAEESATLAKNNVLVQAGTAMLSQANQATQQTLKLIGG